MPRATSKCFLRYLRRIKLFLHNYGWTACISDSVRYAYISLAIFPFHKLIQLIHSPEALTFKHHQFIRLLTDSTTRHHRHHNLNTKQSRCLSNFIVPSVLSWLTVLPSPRARGRPGLSTRVRKTWFALPTNPIRTLQRLAPLLMDPVDTSALPNPRSCLTRTQHFLHRPLLPPKGPSFEAGQPTRDPTAKRTAEAGLPHPTRTDDALWSPSRALGSCLSRRVSPIWNSPAARGNSRKGGHRQDHPEAGPLLPTLPAGPIEKRSFKS